MGDRESKIPDYLKYPYDRFLKLRVEFLIITQNELDTAIMRIIERCIENERFRRSLNAANAGKDLPEQDAQGIFVPISHRFFLQELYGIVQSETTVRDALAHLERNHLIIKRPGEGGPYDPPLYTLNKPLIEYLFSLLPPTLREIDMQAVMKYIWSHRKPKEGEEEVGVQSLDLQPLDPLVKKMRGAIIAPPDPQLLDPYPSNGCTPVSTRGVQSLDPKKIVREKNKKKERKNGLPNVIETATSSSFIPSSFKSSGEEETLKGREEEQSPPNEEKQVFTPEELTEEEHRIHDLVYAHNVARSKQSSYEKIPLKEKQYYRELVPDVPTEHAFLSLFAFSKSRLVGRDNPNAYIGNLASDCQVWKQSYKPPVPKGAPRQLSELEKNNQALMAKYKLDYPAMIARAAR